MYRETMNVPRTLSLKEEVALELLKSPAISNQLLSNYLNNNYGLTTVGDQAFEEILINAKHLAGIFLGESDGI